MRKTSPPSYWRDGELGKRIERILIGNDEYYVEKLNDNENLIILKRFKMRIRYVGRNMWSGKQGTLEIIKKDDKWYAHILIAVGEKPAKKNPRGKVEEDQEIREDY